MPPPFDQGPPYPRSPDSPPYPHIPYLPPPSHANRTRRDSLSSVAGSYHHRSQPPQHAHPRTSPESSSPPLPPRPVPKLSEAAFKALGAERLAHVKDWAREAVRSRESDGCLVWIEEAVVVLPPCRTHPTTSVLHPPAALVLVHPSPSSLLRDNASSTSESMRGVFLDTETLELHPGNLLSVNGVRGMVGELPLFSPSSSSSPSSPPSSLFTTSPLPALLHTLSLHPSTSKEPQGVRLLAKNLLLRPVVGRTQDGRVRVGLSYEAGAFQSVGRALSGGRL
ncbi:hypothetical protein JCM8547_008372 [Rhodosporidiobolus lusitaniae]